MHTVLFFVFLITLKNYPFMEFMIQEWSEIL